VTEVAERVLTGLLTLGVGAWIGGFATVMVISRTSRSVLAAGERVPYFRRFGRNYAVVASIMILLIIVPSAVLASAGGFRPLAAGILAVACALVAITAVGIVQARRMTRLRTLALAGGDNETPGGDARMAVAVRRGAGLAIVLRSAIGIGSLALIVLALVMSLVE
jgi:hypothetical protein